MTPPLRTQTKLRATAVAAASNETVAFSQRMCDGFLQAEQAARHSALCYSTSATRVVIGGVKVPQLTGLLIVGVPVMRKEPATSIVQPLKLGEPPSWIWFAGV